MSRDLSYFVEFRFSSGFTELESTCLTLETDFRVARLSRLSNHDLGVRKIKHIIRIHKISHCQEARSYFHQIMSFIKPI
jgi:hypothetical protein